MTLFVHVYSHKGVIYEVFFHPRNISNHITLDLLIIFKLFRGIACLGAEIQLSGGKQLQFTASRSSKSKPFSRAASVLVSILVGTVHTYILVRPIGRNRDSVDYPSKRGLIYYISHCTSLFSSRNSHRCCGTVQMLEKAQTLTKSILGGPNWAMYIHAEVRTCIQYGIYDDRSITRNLNESASQPPSKSNPYGSLKSPFCHLPFPLPAIQLFCYPPPGKTLQRIGCQCAQLRHQMFVFIASQGQ